MRENLHQLLQQLDSAFAEYDSVTEARATRSFRKGFEQDRRESSTMTHLESTVESIKETADYCRRLAQSIRVTKVELSTMADPLSPGYMEKERRLFERRSEYQRLTQRLEAEPVAAPAEVVTELTQEA